MKPVILAIGLLLFLLPCLLFARAGDGPGSGSGAVSPYQSFTRAWRDGPVWHDGKAECAVYDATRTIYGQQRSYRARIYINKEHASPKTFTKSDDGSGRAVFKLHIRDDIPTKNYMYHYSTMAYVGVDDLKSLKLDMGSQEDCGATFKQFVNHGGGVAWTQHSYFPGEGVRSGLYESTVSLLFQNALPVVLRGYPFDDSEASMRVDIIEDQTDTHLSTSMPRPAVITYLGLETLALPIGEVNAHRLRLAYVDSDDEIDDEAAVGGHDYWFAADKGMRHVMVQHTGPGGVSYRLRSLVRDAYWR